jgi:hypothetical protein
MIKWSILFFLLPFCAEAQFKKIKSFELKDNVVSASVDRPGDLYVEFHSGVIQKYSVDGLLLASSTNAVLPTLFDPRDGARLFTYGKATQSYQFLSPLLEEVSITKMNQAFAIAPYLACTFGDQGMVILDSADWSVKRVNLRTSIVSMEASIQSLISDKTKITFMREYQNFIFLLDQSKGILVLNSMGKLIKTIEVTGLTYFNFLGEELYYLQDGQLKFTDLFTAEKRSMPLPEVCDVALLTDERLYLIKDNLVNILSIEH